MIPYPVWEVDRGLVTFRNAKLGLLLWLFGGDRWGIVTGNGDTGPPEVVCDSADMEIDVIHLTKLLRCLLVVAP